MLTLSHFSSIVQEAYRNGVPRGHERAILREYLQCEMLSLLFEIPESANLAFIGGTSLRLLYDLDRFSEDLDFDCFQAGKENVVPPLSQLSLALQRREYDVVFRQKNSQSERGCTFVFSKLLYLLGLSGYTDETLKIKFDYTYQKLRKTEMRLLNRFGFAEQIVTLPLSILCARKAHALINRKRLQPRDLYDLAWFFTRRIAPDEQTLHSGGIDSRGALLEKINALYASRAGQIAEYERDIRPFLIDPKNIRLIRLLPSLAKSVLLS